MKLVMMLAGACLVLLPFAAGCSAGEGEGQEEAEVNPYGPVIIGPGERYHTHIEREPDVQRGGERGDGRGNNGERTDREGGVGGERAGRDNGGQRDNDPDHRDVRLTGYRVQPATGPTLNQVDVRMRNVSFLRHPFHITSVDSTTFTAQMRDTDVNRYLNQRAHPGQIPMRNIHLAFSPQQVDLTATITRDGRDMAVYSSGRLQPDANGRILYVPNTYLAENAPLSVADQRDLTAQINPVADLHDLHCRPQVQQVTLGNGIATLTGPAAPQGMP